MHDKFIKVRKEIKEMLTTTSVYDLALGLKSRQNSINTINNSHEQLFSTKTIKIKTQWKVKKYG